MHPSMVVPDRPPGSEDDEVGVSGEPADSHVADRTTVGCLYATGALAIAALLYVGFFVFAVLDDRNGWGLLEPYLNERTSEILYFIYWPLIHLYVWLSWQ